MKFIGITGGIGAGKSEILKYIGKHYNSEIYLADDVAKSLEEKGTETHKRLVDLLGGDILGEDGEIDKSLMSKKIYADAGLLEKVNDIVHPAVREFLLARLSEAKAENKCELFFVEAALLVETGYGELVDEMWYVRADEDIRIQRLMDSRGYTEEKARSIINNQLSDDEYMKAADFVLDNSGDLENTYRSIREKLGAFTWLE
ncbi:MAG: dephospho-CoA kinase [Lachnospiraceae bacterium]|nr:dephospho-CoA kinase [Lachnospiraceae bacterium]